MFGQSSGIYTNLGGPLLPGLVTPSTELRVIMTTKVIMTQKTVLDEYLFWGEMTQP